MHSAAALILAYCLVWALSSWWAAGNLDGYHDMLENYAWSQAWDWGTHKHPPFFAWMVGIWFSFMPHTDWAYKLLSYVNVGVGLWGVVVLAKRLGLERFATTAVLLLLWSFPYSTLAGKFNANSQLLSLWPWTAALLLASWQERGTRGVLFSIALGVAAAASMLSKYYSGVFLAGFLVPIFLSPVGRQWLRTPRPYIALAAFAIALTPHVRWIAHHNWISFSYAMDQGGGSTQWGYIARFAFSPIFYWLPAWLACVSVFAAAQKRLHPERGVVRHWLQLAARSWMPENKSDTLFWLAFLPWMLTLLFGLVGVAELSTPWAIPIGFAFSLLWLRNLDAAVPNAARRALSALHRAAWLVLVGVALVSVLLSWRNARSVKTDYYRPSAEAAQAIANGWQLRHRDLALSWVGGDWAENALLAFYALPNARTVPGLPDEYPALFNPVANWSQEGGILLCPRGPYDRDDEPPEVSQDCETQAQAWLLEHGQSTSPHVLTIARQGWRFPKPVKFVYAIYDVLPAATNPKAAAQP